MKPIERRLNALETRSPKNNALWIWYVYGDEKDEATSKAEALSEWEAEHGPLDGIEPNFIAVRLVAPNPIIPKARAIAPLLHQIVPATF